MQDDNVLEMMAAMVAQRLDLMPLKNGQDSRLHVVYFTMIRKYRYIHIYISMQNFFKFYIELKCTHRRTQLDELNTPWQETELFSFPKPPSLFSFLCHAFPVVFIHSESIPSGGPSGGGRRNRVEGSRWRSLTVRSRPAPLLPETRA